jgi:hypothetical protein
MGATSWRYYTSYDPDPARALKRLRDEVFARGEFVDLTGSLEDQLRATMKRFGRDPDDAEARRDIQRNLQMQRAVDFGRKEDLEGLSAEERSFVRRMRWITRIARWFGDGPPKARKRGKPRSIDDLLERAEESGTHSILDITEVASRRREGAAAPLGARVIEKMFGTPQPTRDQVEVGWQDVAETLRREHACYLVVFRDGEPDEYAFIGVSGD